jgi:hypothetical protein
MDQPLIAVRIKDGIFVGNVTAAHDEDFLTMNKCTHVVNCAGSEVRDLFNGTIQYLTFQWKDTNSAVCTTVMFDSADRNVESAIRFIDKALEAGECVLIHSYFGVSRAPALCAAYLMVKYGWNLDNTLQFMAMAHQDMEIKPYFLRQLRTFAKRHEVDVDIFDPRVDESHFSLDNEQWMLRNTFVNGLVADVQETHDLYRTASTQIKLCEANYKNAARRRRRITFTDTKQGTSVASDLTQPLAQPERVQQHFDPTTGVAFVVSRTAPGAPPPQPILSRRGSPNGHKLEADHANRGAMVLPLRPEYGQQKMHSANPDLTLSARSGGPISPANGGGGSGGGGVDGGTFTLRGYGSLAPPTSSQLPPRTIPNSNDSISRASPVAVPRDVTALPPQQQQQQTTTPLGGSYTSQPSNYTAPPNLSAQRSSMAPPVASNNNNNARTTKIQNPFTMTTAGSARKGSPLPKRQIAGATGQPVSGSGSAGSGGPPAMAGGAIQRGRTLTHPTVGLAGSFGGGVGSRASSPMSAQQQQLQPQPQPQRRISRANSPQPETYKPRTGSPLSRSNVGLAGNGSAAAAPMSAVYSSTGRASPTTHNIFQQQQPQQQSVTDDYPAALRDNHPELSARSGARRIVFWPIQQRPRCADHGGADVPVAGRAATAGKRRPSLQPHGPPRVVADGRAAHRVARVAPAAGVESGRGGHCIGPRQPAASGRAVSEQRAARIELRPRDSRVGAASRIGHDATVSAKGIPASTCTIPPTSAEGAEI